MARSRRASCSTTPIRRTFYPVLSKLQIERVTEIRNRSGGKSVETANEIGRSAEERVAKILKGGRIVQSGGGKFLKLDVRDKVKFIYSIKASRALRDSAVRAIWKLWLEASRGARGPAGHGNNAKPALVFEINNELLVLTRLEDHALLATGKIGPHITSSKAAERRAQAIANPRDRR